MRGRPTLVAVALMFTVAGCGGGAEERPARSTPTPAAPLVDGRNLQRNGISIAAPEGWDGRMLFREPTGTTGVIFQVANFELPAHEGLDPPTAADGRDRIKEMDGRDVLITILTDQPHGVPIRGAVRLADLTFLPRGIPRVPHGHALAEGSVCLRARCLAVSVDFGGAPPDPGLLRSADDVLASVAIDGQRVIVLDGLRLEVPPHWHGYATTVGTNGSQPVIWAANVVLAEAPSRPAFPGEKLARLPSAGVAIEAVAAPSTGPRVSAPFTDGPTAARQVDLPLRLADGTFLARDYEGQPAAHVSTVMIEGQVGRRSFFVQVYFGRNEPTGDMRAAAATVLASFSLVDARR